MASQQPHDVGRQPYWPSGDMSFEPAPLTASYYGTEQPMTFCDEWTMQWTEPSHHPLSPKSSGHTIGSSEAANTFLVPDDASQPFAFDETCKSTLPTMTSSLWDPDLTQEEGSPRLVCSECNKAFANLRALDKHTQSTSHRAWICSEAGCEKSYARRDTYLRHRSTHKDSSYPCVDCTKQGRLKVFKRKDHLREHVKSCHTGNIDSTRSNPDLAHNSAAPVERAVGDKPSERESDVLLPQQQQAMKDLVRSLGIVLGDRHPTLIGKLGDRVTTMSGQDMERIAEHMAVSALAKAYLHAPEADDLRL